MMIAVSEINRKEEFTGGDVDDTSERNFIGPRLISLNNFHVSEIEVIECNHFLITGNSI